MPIDQRASTPLTTRRVVRTIVAVVAGYLIFALSAVALFQVSGRDPHAAQPSGFEIFTVAYGMAFATLGGFVAARLAPVRPLMHAGAVAIVLAVGAAVSLVASPGSGATWSQWTALVLMTPSAYFGGRVARR